ncbi:MAG: ATP-binding protein [Microscillaceae bacterium]|jgi:predicted HTH transcriptional regulator|nr:ATP-binding protein [Microscillaceae bacterium]
MDFLTLKKLVRQGEGSRLEFKLKAKYPEKIVREAVAFANSEGGILLIGVDDDKTIKGVKFPLEEEYVLEKAFAEYCIPHFKYQLVKIPTEGEREVLMFHIPKSDRIHYVLDNPKHKRGKAYVRVDDKSVQASYEMLEILRGNLKKRNVKFNYGDKERVLMQYLAINHKITVSQFSKTANIPRNLASQTLILLVLAKVLQIKPSEVEDSFEFVEPEK